MPLFENLDAFFIASCKQSGKSFNPCLLPSRSQGNLRIIRNLRFFGNMGSYFNPEYPPHPQSIGTRTFPQLSIIATIQYWFPSPDGTILVPNQTGDTIGKLDPKRTGRLLNLIEAYLVSPSPSDTEKFKLSLYDLLMKSERSTPQTKYQKLLTEYPEFCLHDFKSIFSRELYRNFEFLTEEQLTALKKENILQDDPLFLTKILKFLYRVRNYSNFPLFENDFLKDGELESYREALVSDSIPEKNLAARLRYFKNKEKSFTTVRFVEVLVKSLNDQRQDHLPHALVERTIFSFFLKKAKTPDDILSFLSGYLDVDPETLRPNFPKTVFSGKTYWTIRNNPEDLKAALSHPEKAAFLSFGYQSYEDPFPPLIDY
ncbi:MAG: hypothetical protein B7Y25_04020 [Alphaproteobacteria bacterium 16-39-46]|nr:MAG: hypothetical protein B7Y25_04020 [Alphaproteobacteria bacterium 16-39-46]OZA43100.1 MAG: hypothetical protein B7X84_04155 [Alphaproteobacteria bacterium 17-39-52]HQS84335.1 hypothetical protein [Alphaproteobacteria bacterium]HQS93938.1 hypothetical protein [Alphaproteobacteria bacterium]